MLNIQLELGASYRIQLLLQQLSHFTNIDIKVTWESSGNVLSFALFDAANNSLYKHRLLPTFKEAKVNNACIQDLNYTEEVIQYGELTCPIISFLLAKNLSKIVDLHEMLVKNNPNDGPIRWQNLPNHFILMG